MFKVIYKTIGFGTGVTQFESVEELNEGLRKLKEKYKNQSGKSLIMKIDIKENDRLIEGYEYEKFGIKLAE